MQTPVGWLGVRVGAERVQEIRWLEEPPAALAGVPHDPLSREVQRQLQAYFRDPDWPFDLPLAPARTRFQQRVRVCLQGIPRSTTCTYGELARELGSGARALGNACRANPFPIVVPCHRVTAAHDLGGYAGAVGGRLLEVKRWLLAHEA
jgi:methylated-DNA-[protein]-cysteine S-methyltransferase